MSCLSSVCVCHSVCMFTFQHCGSALCAASIPVLTCLLCLVSIGYSLYRVISAVLRDRCLLVHSPPEIAQPTKPKVALKPVITRQLSVLAPFSQISTDSRSSLQLPAESPGSIKLGPCTATTFPLYHDTRIGSGINDAESCRIDSE